MRFLLSCAIILFTCLPACSSNRPSVYHSLPSSFQQQDTVGENEVIPVYFNNKNISCDNPHYFSISLQATLPPSSSFPSWWETVRSFLSNNKRSDKDFHVVFGMMNDLEIDQVSLSNHIHVLRAFTASELTSVNLCVAKYFTYFLVIASEQSSDLTASSQLKICDKYRMVSADGSMLFLSSDVSAAARKRSRRVTSAPSCSLRSDLLSFVSLRDTIVSKTKDFLYSESAPAKTEEVRHFLRLEREKQTARQAEVMPSVSVAMVERVTSQLSPLIYRLESSAVPTSRPSLQPTICIDEPTSFPSAQPSRSVTSLQTHSPTIFHSLQPTSATSFGDTTVPSTTFAPSEAPASHPSSLPSSSPSASPSLVTSSPVSHAPTHSLTATPSSTPSQSPTTRSTTSDSSHPSHSPPTATPSSLPSSLPSSQPTSLPSSIPSQQPSLHSSPPLTSSPSLSDVPSITPSEQPLPTSRPSLLPSSHPSTTPTTTTTNATTTTTPTIHPTTSTTTNTTSLDTSSPTTSPTSPSDIPSLAPSATPSETSMPSSHPSSQPSSTPSFRPTASTSSHATIIPTTSVTLFPTAVMTFFNTSFNGSSSKASILTQTTAFIGSVSAAGSVGVATTATASYYALQIAKTVLPGLPAAPAGLAGSV